MLPFTTEDEALIAQIELVLESARELVVESFVEDRVSPVESVDRLLVESSSGGKQWSARWEQVEVNVLSVLPRFEYASVLESWTAGASELATVLERAYRGSLPPPSAIYLMGRELFGDETSAADPEPWQRVRAEFVGAPTRWYLTHAESVGAPSPQLAREIAEQVIDVLRSGQFEIRQDIPLEALHLEKDLVCGHTRVRRLTPEERGEFVEHSLPRARSRYGNLLTGGFVMAPTVQLEVTSVGTDPQRYGMIPLPDVLLALQLHQVPIVGPGTVLTHIHPEWYSLGTSGRSVSMRRFAIDPDQYALTQHTLDAACKTAERLARYHLDDPQRAAELALRRFSLGCGREDFADALVDFVIALEGLLLPYDEQTRYAELGYRFRLHGAHFISSHSIERREIFKQLRRLYELRSRLVHGNSYPTGTEIMAAMREARSLAARGLLKAVDEGFPDPVYFSRALLGEE